MAWVKMIEPYTYRKPAFSIRYQPGVYNVKAECATLAIAAGKAKRMRKPNKGAEPVEWNETPPLKSETHEPDNSAS